MIIQDGLINKCKAKDRFAQKELYMILLPYLGAVVRRYLFDKSFEKDILQDTFVKIFKNISQFNAAKGAFHKWAVRIAINTCFSHNSRKSAIKEEELYVEIHDIPSQPLKYSKISNEQLLGILRKMPASYFEIFNLFIIDEFDHKEIAELLNINEQLSRQRLSRAKVWLRKYFNEAFGNPTIKLMRQFFLN